MWRRSEDNSSLSVRYVYLVRRRWKTDRRARTDPIASEGLEFSEEHAPDEPLGVCVEVSDRLLSWKTLTKSESNHPEEVTFSIN